MIIWRLSNLTELRHLDRAERMRVIGRWESESLKPWSGYLIYFGLFLLVMLPTICLSELLFGGGFVTAMFAGLAILVTQILYRGLILSRRRDLLQRILEERRRTPAVAIGPSLFSLHLLRAWLAVISYSLLFMVIPVFLVCFAWHFGLGAIIGALLLLFPFIAAGETGFRIWKRVWRIP